ncbi:MAG: Nif3-like dinuclear metal center hexameric protein [Gemmatimonadaceae bacterium]
MARSRLSEVAGYIDGVLRISEIPDHPHALNGLQVENDGEITGVAAAVDARSTTINGAVDAGMSLLLVHHGLFWSGLKPFTGAYRRKISMLLQNNVALYSAHLPLDAHAEIGNNVLLARALGLDPSGGFARHEAIHIGVQGNTELPSADLVVRCADFAAKYGGIARSAGLTPSRMTRRWAICTGAGASSDTIAEARESGIDTLIVGEGPHWTAVDAEEYDLVIIYAGHYATETLGVQALAKDLALRFGFPWKFVHAPTGL